MGGEKFPQGLKSLCRRGSPPRGRGKVDGLDEVALLAGITPAWAGKRVFICSYFSRIWDHPRVGGEKFPQGLKSLCRRGSPPRGRGKVKDAVSPRRFVGITPAWAGKREMPPYRQLLSRDHPRVGGEKHQDDLEDLIQQGSPPRGRGKVDLSRSLISFMRITPAWAGKRR